MYLKNNKFIKYWHYKISLRSHNLTIFVIQPMQCQKYAKYAQNSKVTIGNSCTKETVVFSAHYQRLSLKRSFLIIDYFIGIFFFILEITWCIIRTSAKSALEVLNLSM